MIGLIKIKRTSPTQSMRQSVHTKGELVSLTHNPTTRFLIFINLNIIAITKKK